MRFKRSFAAAAATFFCMASLPFDPIFADEANLKNDYLIFGDSISTGYGLSEPEAEGFAYLIADEIDYELINAAIDGNTASGIYEQIKDGTYDKQIADAELISLTCGGNDMMALFYQLVADYYNEYNSYKITASDVSLGFAGKSDIVTQNVLMPYAMKAVIGFPETEEFSNGLTNYLENLTNVMTYIRNINPDAEVIIPTQYNPYKAFKNSKTFSYIHKNMDAGAAKLNTVISENAENLGYSVADVYTAFDKSTDKLTNVNTSLDNINLDFHPNSAGHSLIAETMLAITELPPKIIGYHYSIEYKPSAFYFSDDTNFLKPDDLITEVMRYPVSSDGSIKNEGECVTELNRISLNSLSPALLYTEGGISYSITATITDEYGTQDIADAVVIRIGLRGDADGNSIVNAADAAAILVSAAAAGAGDTASDPAMDKETTKFRGFLANVDENGTMADAKDAAYVLTYAAMTSTGHTISWDEMLNPTIS